MSKQEFHTLSPTKVTSDEFEEREPSAEFIDELREGVECFVFLITICDVLLLSIFTIALLVTLPVLSPVGILFIIHLINHYFNNLEKL